MKRNLAWVKSRLQPFFNHRNALSFLLAITIMISPSYAVRFSVLGLKTNLLMIFLSVLLIIVYGQIILTHYAHTQAIRTLKQLTIQERLSLILLAAACLSTATNFSVHGFGLFIALFLQPILLALGIWKSGIKLNQQIILYGIIILLYVNGILCVLQYHNLWLLPAAYWGNDLEPKRALGIFSHPNANALFVAPLLALLLPFIWNLWKIPKHFSTKTFWIIGWVFGTIGLLLSLSRAGYLALAFTLTIFLFKNLNKKQLAITISTGIICGLVIISFLPIVRYRLSHAFFQDNASSARLELWHGASKLIKANPILGIGLGGFEDRYESLHINPIYGKHTSPHNIFLHFWLETGIVGLFAFIGLCICAIKKWVLSNSPTQQAQAVGLFVLAIVIHGLFDIAYFKNDLALVFWMILAAFG